MSALADWLARLETYSPVEIVLGLERVESVLERLDLAPIPTVLHVAGTNGKGSCVAMIEAIALDAGMRVGCYTSPHILRYNERIRVDGEAVDDATVIAAFERVEACRGDTPLTYFEFGTLAALAAFEVAGVPMAVLEIGMGGRLDAVNAVEPTAGLITNVSLDHCDWLGEDVEAIGREKAGIMRAGKPAVFADGNCPQSVLETAADVGADLVLQGRDYTFDGDGQAGWSWRGRSHALDGLPFPPFGGGAQMYNAAGVLALLEAAGFSELLDVERIRSAWADLSLEGRMQTIRTDREWLVDVAHNQAAAGELAFRLETDAPAGETVAIVGALDDKDVEGVIQELQRGIDRFIAVTADSPRAIDAEALAQRIANASGKPCLEAESIGSALEFAEDSTGSDDRIVVTGSFYVVAPVLEALYSRR